MIVPVLVVRERGEDTAARPVEDVRDAWLEGNANRAVPYKLSFLTRDRLTARGAWIDVHVDAPTGRVQRGSYVITRVAQARDVGWWEVSAQDVFAEVARVPAAGPVSPRPGWTLAQFLSYLLHPVPVDYRGPAITLPRGLVVERDRIAAAQQLMAQHGLAGGLRDGRFVVSESGAPGDVVPIPAGWTLVPEWGTSLETPNSVVVTGNRAGVDGGDDTVFRVVAATREGELAPHKYGTTRVHIDAPTLTTPGAALTYAHRELAARQGALEAVRLDTLPIPGIQLGDHVLATRPEGPPLAGVVTGFSLPLDATARMTLNLEPR